LLLLHKYTTYLQTTKLFCNYFKDISKITKTTANMGIYKSAA